MCERFRYLKLFVLNYNKIIKSFNWKSLCYVSIFIKCLTLDAHKKYF